MTGLRVVRATGDATERGQQIGRELRDLVNESIDFYHRYLARRGVSSQQLQERLDDPTKRWKFRREDLETRARWDDVMAGYEAALTETSTDWAPWDVVPADRRRRDPVPVPQWEVRPLHALLQPRERARPAPSRGSSCMPHPTRPQSSA